QEHRIDREAVARLRVDRLHCPRLFGAQDILHLHRFDHRERLAGLDLVAFAHVEPGEQARHRADQEAGEVGRQLFDHVTRELGDMRRVDGHDTAGPSSSAPSRARAASLKDMPAATAASPSSRSAEAGAPWKPSGYSSAMKPVVIAPSRKRGCCISAERKSTLWPIPSIRNPSSASICRSIAASRVGPVVTSLAIIGSQKIETAPPSS